MTTLYLIRHGQASVGTSNYDVLSALGQKQSELLGAYLKKTGIRFDQVISGTLQRQIDTTRISLTLDPLMFEQNPAFNEYHHQKIFDHYAARLAHINPQIAKIHARGHNAQLTYEVFSTLMNSWVEDVQSYPELESWTQFKERISYGLASVTDNSDNKQNIAIFTSGGVICTILQSIANFPTAKIFELNWGIYNASVTTLKTKGSTIKLRTYNSIAHLELENDNSLISNI